MTTALTALLPTLEQDSPERLRTVVLPSLTTGMELCSAALGVVLHAIYQSGAWTQWTHPRGKRYEHFHDFCRYEAPRAYTTCMELMNNWRYAKGLGYSAQEFIEISTAIGWGKIKQLRRFALSRVDAEHIIASARSGGYVSEQSLREMLRERERLRGEAGSGQLIPCAYHYCMFHVPLEWWPAIEQALNDIRDRFGVHTRERALFLMASRYLISFGIDPTLSPQREKTDLH